MYAGLSCLVCISDRREDNTWTLLNQQHFRNDTAEALLWDPHCYTTACVQKARGISDGLPGGAARAFTTMLDSFVS